MDPDKVPVKTVLERAEELGRSTGVVTTVPIQSRNSGGFPGAQPQPQ